MRFHEQAVDTGGHCRRGERRNVLARAAARPTLAAPRLLHRMRRVEDHGRIACGAHPGNRTHVDDEVAVSEEGAALGDGDLITVRQRRAFAAATAGTHLRRGPPHPFRLQPLALLDVDRQPGRASRFEEVGLPAEERRNLERIDHLSGRPALLGQVHVGDHRQPSRLLHARERRESRVEPGAARRARVRPVRLVEARLEHDTAGHALGEPCEVFSDAKIQCVVLELTRARQQEQRAARKERAPRIGHAATSASARRSTLARAC